jgi:hypothetical protein
MDYMNFGPGQIEAPSPLHSFRTGPEILASGGSRKSGGGMAVIMIKSRFSKPIRGSTTLFFISAEKKWKKNFMRDGGRWFASDSSLPFF